MRRRLSEAERRRQILAATVAVVAADGYDAAALARIAEAAGVSKGLVSHYFGDKDSLMAQTARSTAVALREAVAADLDLAAPVPAIMRAALRAAAGLAATHRAEVTAVRRIADNLRGPDGSPGLRLSDYEETYQAQERLFRRGQAEGTLRQFDTRVMAVTYQGAIDVMLAYLDEHPELDPTSYADDLADLLVAAVSCSPAPPATG